MLFNFMAKANLFSKAFGNRTHTLRIYFNDFEHYDFKNYMQFKNYVNRIYVPEYYQALLKCKGTTTQNRSILFVFECNGEEECVEVYLYE